MKTSERMLTEWVSDDILFNYTDNRGVIHHNREQFIKVCNVFRAGREDAEPEATTNPPIVSGNPGYARGGFPVGVSGTIFSLPIVSGNLTSFESRRMDISKVINWNTSQRVHAACTTFRSLLQKNLNELEPWIESQIRGFFDPQKVARFENARELIDHIVRIGQSITIKGT